MLTNGARASRLVISNVTTGMDSNRPNFDCQTHELINKCKPRHVDVKVITQNIVGWELDEVGEDETADSIKLGNLAWGEGI